MTLSTILERHYSNASVAASRSSWFDRLNCSADQRALGCAALHVGIDAMSRVTRKRAPQAGYVARYPAIVRRPQHEVTNGAVAILARHSQRVHDARNVVKDCSASLQATTVALVSVLR